MSLRRMFTAFGVVAMVGLMNGAPGWATEDPTAPAARTRAEELLRQPEFQPDNQPTSGSPLERSARQVEKWFQGPSTTTTTRPATTTTTASRKPRESRPQGDLSWLEQLIRVLAYGLIAVIAATLGALVIWAIVRRTRNKKSPQAKGRARKKLDGTATLSLADELDPDVVELSEPEALEALADEAERNADFSRAVRLRFRAGLYRLDEAGVLQFDASLTTGQLMRTLRNGTFDGLAVSFDTVVYAQQPATLDEVRAARTGWPQVLDDCTRLLSGAR